MLSFFVAFPAAAQPKEPTERDKKAARSLVQQGDELMTKKEYDKALEAYIRADDIMGVPTTGIEVGKVHLLLGHLVEAGDAFERVSNYPERAGEPKPFTKARDEAAELLVEVRRRTPKLTIDVEGHKPEDDVVVTINGEIVDAWARTMPVNPGSHIIEAEADGYEGASEALVIGEKEDRSVTLELIPKASSADDGEPGTGMLVLAYGGLALSGLGTAVSTISGAVALSAASALSERCPDGICPRDEEPLLDERTTAANVSTTFLVFALAGTVVGSVGLSLVLSDGDDRSSDGEEDDDEVVLRLSPGWVGLQGHF